MGKPQAHWVVFNGSAIVCEACGEKRELSLPMAVQDFNEVVGDMVGKHGECYAPPPLEALRDLVSAIAEAQVHGSRDMWSYVKRPCRAAERTLAQYSGGGET